MRIRSFTAGTQRGYIRAVRDFTAFSGRSADQAGAEDLRRHQLEMRSSGASATSMYAIVSALRFLFGVTLGRDDVQAGMTAAGAPRTSPERAGCSASQHHKHEPDDVSAHEPPMLSYSCPSCGEPMIIIETFGRRHAPRAPPPRKADRP